MTHPQSPTPKGAATRMHILDTAGRAFASQGFSQTRMDDIVAASGLTKGAVYFHFTSKADLARAVVESRKRAMLTEARELTSHFTTPKDEFDALVSALLELIVSDPASWSVVHLEQELAESGNELFQKDSIWEEWVDLVAEILERGRNDNSFNFDASAREVATIFVGAFDGVKTILDGTGRNDAASTRAHIAVLARFFDSALGRI